MIEPDEWASLCLIIEEGWPGEFTDAAEQAWRLLLDDYDAGQVLAAVKGLVARGGAFRPSVAEVVAEIRRDPSRPTFEEMCWLVFGPGGILKARPAPGGRYDNEAHMLKARDDAALDRAREFHPLVSSFVERFGVARLRTLDLEDPEYGELRRRDLREAWDRHREAMEGREVTALVAGRRDGLRALDPLAAVGAPRKQITQ